MKPSWSILILLSFALTACPSAEPPPPGPEPEPSPSPEPGAAVTRLGLINFNENNFRDLGLEDPLRSGSAIFADIEETPADTYDDLTLGDGCFVFQNPSEEEPFEEDLEPVSLLDAGAQVTASAAGEIYAVLERSEEDGEILYFTDFEQNLPPLPTTAFSVDIPGAAFPAFSAAAPGAGPVLDFTNPEDLTDISPISTFSWVAAPVEGASSFVTLFISQMLDGVDGEKSSVDVFCFLEDDGTFGFSPETQADMQAAGFTSGALTLSGRTVTRAEVEGDAAVVLGVSNSTFFGTAQTFTREREQLFHNILRDHLQKGLQGR